MFKEWTVHTRDVQGRTLARIVSILDHKLALTAPETVPRHHDPDIVASEKGALHRQVRGAPPVVTGCVAVMVSEGLAVDVPVTPAATLGGGSL